MPCGSRMRRAYSKHDCRTEQVAQMALARVSRPSFSSFRSKVVGGKNTAAWGPRHAALACHRSSTRWALKETPLPAGKLLLDFAADKTNFAKCGSESAGQPGAAAQ